MRQLLIQVPRGQGAKVVEMAQSQDGTNLAWFEAFDGDEPRDAILVHVSNPKVETLVADLQRLADVRLTLAPQGVITLRPPEFEAPEQARDVGERSPIEIFLSGLQSIGSWRGFLGYAVAAGFVVWVGLFTDTSYLLVAAMLIAPFAGPAMNLALGTARGDAILIRRSVLRYFSAIAVTTSVCSLLSLLFGQDIATAQMVATTSISSAAVILPLAAGAAGALNLVQSERSSMVSGAAVGMLVAASLAPPAGVTGMAGVLGEWGMVKSGLFLLLLQLAGINVSGAIVFRLFGLSARGTRYNRGRRWLFPASMMASAVVLAALLIWQFRLSPELQRATRSQRAAAEIQKLVNASGIARLVEADVRFTRADISNQNTLLGVLYVERSGGETDDYIRTRLTQDIQSRLFDSGFNVVPLISVSVLERPVPHE